MKSHWYNLVRIRTEIMVFLLILSSSVLTFKLIEQSQIQTTVNNRLSEINRYAILVANNISVSQFLGSGSSSDLYDEVDSMASFYTEARILVLNDYCRVQKDSATTRRGRTIINDDILLALSGSSQSHVDGMYGCIAVPIMNYRTSETNGVVYVSFSLDKQIQRAKNSMESFGMILMIVMLIMFLLIVGIIELAFYPLGELLHWVREVVRGHGEHPPFHKSKSEYGQVVRSMNMVIEDLRDVDNSRKEFVSNVSHELKTPLSSMKVLAESLLLEEGADEETYREFLSDINDEIDRETALVNDLLSLVRLENNKNALNIRMISINDLCEIILNRLRPLAEQKKIQLQLETSSDVEAEVDEMKMTIAISNLVENGIKYNKEGGTVRVKVDSGLSDAIISVSDTGIGIPEEHFNKIFQRFYRVDKARERAAGGTGLGLAIVHQIVTMHHGTITVDSKVDEGTTFTMRFPLIAAMTTKVMNASGGKE